MKKIFVYFVVGAIFYSTGVGAPYVADSHTLALYHLDEGSGSIAYDSSGNNKNGTLVGSDISWTSGRYDDGIKLTSVIGGNTAGRGSKITLPTNLLSKINFTVQMDLNWDYLSQFPITGDNSAGYLLSGGGSNMWVRGRINTSNPARNKCDLLFGVYTYAGWLQITTPSEFALQDNQWTNVAFTSSWEDIGGGVYNTVARILINGQVAAEAYSPSGPLAGPGTPYIGRSDTYLSWGGKIDEVRILDYAIQVPEPTTMSLLGIGLFAAFRKKQN